MRIVLEEEWLTIKYYKPNLPEIQTFLKHRLLWTCCRFALNWTWPYLCIFRQGCYAGVVIVRWMPKLT